MKTGRATFSPAMETATGYNRWIIESFLPELKGTILEVGFGHQGFRSLLPDGAKYIGVDIDPDVVREARRARPGMLVLEADVADPSFPRTLAPHDVDVALCINVLEHVADDAAAVVNLLSCLRTGGRLCLFVPALSWLYNDLDRLVGHRRRYRKADVAALVPRDRGRIRRIEYFNPVGGVGWWLNGLIRHQDLAHRSVTCQVALFDRLARPLSRALNPLTKGFFGQSVLAVIEKT